MSATYRTNTMLVPATAAHAHVDALNEAMEGAGLGRPFGQPQPDEVHALVRVPVAGDPLAIRDAVRTLNRDQGTGLSEPKPEFQFRVGTVDDTVRHRKFFAAGVKHGHGHAAVSWLPERPDELGDPPPRRPVSELPGGRRPVVALLDNGVHADHPWLREHVTDEDPFCVDAETEGWMPTVSIPDPATPTVPLDPQDRGPADKLGENFGSHYGHGTFIAGLIRRAAPDARVLSVRVMSDDGEVSDDNVADALKWLADHYQERRVDVVCMAFGRQTVADDPEMRSVREQVQRLAQHGVPLVVSAGNEGVDHPMTFPAGWSLESSLVVSVGAGTPAQPSSFSNRGDWVNAWEDGEDVVSVMPLTPLDDTGDPGAGYATWSGTSFAAGTRAGSTVR
jgi:hypothetical protein